MKRLLCLALVAMIAALAHEPAGGVAPIRKPHVDELPRGFVNSLGMKFTWIPPGSFIMGSPKEEQIHGGGGSETRHKVTLTKGFFMGVHLVTQEEWQAVIGSNPSHFKGEKNLPVENVSWKQCQEFVTKLRQKDNKPYRLPSDAEWEYACRAGTKTAFWFGDTISTDQANFDGKGPRVKGNAVNRQKTTSVAAFPPNPWGLHDMHGNLWQWCQDLSGSFSNADVTDPQGPTHIGGGRVFRGGCWMMDAYNCRAAAHGAGIDNQGFVFIGLRVCFFAE